jgi:hypothetical protein
LIARLIAEFVAQQLSAMSKSVTKQTFQLRSSAMQTALQTKLSGRIQFWGAVLGALLCAPALATTPVGCETAFLDEPIRFGVGIDAVYTVVANKCATCHTVSSSGGMNLPDAATTFTRWVNVVPNNATAALDTLRIKPFDPAFSFVFLKINCANPGAGSRMPLGRAALTAPEQALIYDWIQQGAPQAANPDVITKGRFEDRQNAF